MTSSLFRRGFVVAIALASFGCGKGGMSAPHHRERTAARDKDCKEGDKPRAFFYPAENRTDYKPDDPHKDNCALLVPDHLFCCPAASRPEDR